MLKEIQVVMLSTKEASNMYIATDLQQRRKLCAGELYESTGRAGQHLYFLSDEEIKEGDWCVNMYGDKRSIFKVTKVLTDGYEGQKAGEWHCFYGLQQTLKKIIATTHSSLFQSFTIENWGNNREPLPTCSQSFIQKYIERYNAGKPIEKVMVDYEEYYDGEKYKISYPKLRSNEIIIHPVKETFTREEVKGIICQYNDEHPLQRGVQYSVNEVIKWFNSKY